MPAMPMITPSNPDVISMSGDTDVVARKDPSMRHSSSVRRIVAVGLTVGRIVRATHRPSIAKPTSVVDPPPSIITVRIVCMLLDQSALGGCQFPRRHDCNSIVTDPT